MTVWHKRPGSACAPAQSRRLTALGVERAGASDECINERGRRLFEQRLEHDGGHRVGESEAHRELDPATLADGRELPLALELAEGSAHERHLDAAVGFERVARGD